VKRLFDGESGNYTSRFETVNTTNTPQFSNPNGSCCTANNSNFGFVTGTIGSGSGSINAGTGGPRTLQLAGTFTFYLRFSDRGGAPPR
jgi:hypothetical protein